MLQLPHRQGVHTGADSSHQDDSWDRRPSGGVLRQGLPVSSRDVSGTWHKDPPPPKLHRLPHHSVSGELDRALG